MNIPQLLQVYESITNPVQRIYVGFSSDYIPLWTPLVRLGIRKYQRSPVTYSHTYLIVQDVQLNTLYLYEMDFFSGMNMYSIEYEGPARLDSLNHELSIKQTQFNGIVTEVTFNVVDVTPLINDNDIDVDFNFHECYTDKRLTPLTLLRHLFPKMDKVTWTCSGLTQALIGMPRTQAFLNPLTPDQLYERLTR
jgi:hypothetical protein